MQSTETCSLCGVPSREAMSDKARRLNERCPACGLPGDWCVFSSYGDVLCPPLQRERAAQH